MRVDFAAFNVSFETIMSLPGGAVSVVVVSFIFCPLALLALVARLWSRRKMKLKLRSNDFSAIAATVCTFEEIHIKGNLGSIQPTNDRFLWLEKPQASLVVSLLLYMNHDRFYTHYSL